MQSHSINMQKTKSLQGTKTGSDATDHDSDGAKIGEDVVTDLAYLAGGLGQHSVTLNDLRGWEAGTAIVDTTHRDWGFLDTAQIYKKNGSCAIVFSATDDDIDNQQQMMGSVMPTSFCGAEGVNGGYAQEMQGYMHASGWAAGMQELSGCSTIYAAGHSMGGAMATLFAYCANTQASFDYKALFGSLPEVYLVTFGAPAPATTPLYNGQPGQCFTGTRRFVSATPTPAQKQFHLQNLALFAQLAQALGRSKGAEDLALAAQNLSSLDYPSEHATAVLASAAGGIGTMWLLAYGIMTNTVLPGSEKLAPMYPALQASMGTFLQSNAMSLLYSYDPVPQLFQTFGFKHPLVKTEPQEHSLTRAQTSAGAECDAEGDTPNEDYAQLFWGLLMANAGSSGLSFPNHGMCCLISDENCAAQFTGTYGVTCPMSMFR